MLLSTWTFTWRWLCSSTGVPEPQMLYLWLFMTHLGRGALGVTWFSKRSKVSSWKDEKPVKWTSMLLKTERRVFVRSNKISGLQTLKIDSLLLLEHLCILIGMLVSVWHNSLLSIKWLSSLDAYISVRAGWDHANRCRTNEQNKGWIRIC